VRRNKKEGKESGAHHPVYAACFIFVGTCDGDGEIIWATTRVRPDDAFGMMRGNKKEEFLETPNAVSGY